MYRKWYESLDDFEGPSGDFWKSSKNIPETCNFAELSHFMLLITQSSTKIKAHNKITESSSPTWIPCYTS